MGLSSWELFRLEGALHIWRFLIFRNGINKCYQFSTNLPVLCWRFETFILSKRNFIHSSFDVETAFMMMKIPYASKTTKVCRELIRNILMLLSTVHIIFGCIFYGYYSFFQCWRQNHFHRIPPLPDAINLCCLTLIFNVNSFNFGFLVATRTNLSTPQDNNFCFSWQYWH